MSLAIAVPPFAVASASALIAASESIEFNRSTKFAFSSTNGLVSQAAALAAAGAQHAALLLAVDRRRLWEEREDGSDIREEGADYSPHQMGASAELVSAIVYCTVILSILSSCLSGTVRFGIRSGGPTSRTLTAAASVAGILPASSIFPLLYASSFLVGSENPPKEVSFRFMAVSFLCAAMVLTTLRWAFRFVAGFRSLYLLRPLSSMPAMESHIGDGYSYDRWPWYEWTPSQVIAWASDLPDVSLRYVTDVLEPERIDGASLEVLTLSDLRSFGMPYGDAVRLRSYIMKLMMQHGGGRTRREEERFMRYGPCTAPQMHNFSNTEQWLDPTKKDFGECAHKEFIGETDDSYPQPQTEDYDPINTRNSSVTAQKLFADRFGMNLPELRTNLRSSPDISAPDQEKSDLICPTMSVLSKPPVTTAGGVGALLSAMPPEVRDAASRHPDLLQVLLEKKRSAQRANGYGLLEKVQLLGDAISEPMVLPPCPTPSSFLGAVVPKLMSADIKAASAPLSGGVQRRFLSSVQESRLHRDPSHAQSHMGACAAAEILGVSVASQVTPLETCDETDEIKYAESDEECASLLRKRVIR